MAGIANTPSQSSNITDALDLLVNSIVGNKTETSIGQLLSDISKGVQKDTLLDIINTSEISQYTAASANMLAAIAGLLYGDKGVDINTKASTLLSKVTSNKPSIGTSSATQGNSASAKLDVTIKGINGKGLDGLITVMNLLQSNFKASNIDNFKSLVKAISILDSLSNELSKINFSKFDQSYIKSFNIFSNILEKNIKVSKSLLKNLVFSVLIDSFKTELLAYPATLSLFIGGKNGRGGLIMLFNRLGKIDIANIKKLGILRANIGQLINIGQLLDSNTKIFKSFVNNADLRAEFLLSLSDLISKKGGLLELQSAIDKFSSTGASEHIIKEFLEDLSSIFQSIVSLGKLSISAGKMGKHIIAATGRIIPICEAISGFDYSKIKNVPKDFKNIKRVIKDLTSIFMTVTIAGIFAIPALLGAVILKSTIKLILTSIQDIVKTMSKIKFKKLKADILETIKCIILVSALVAMAGLAGSVAIKYTKEILGFVAIFTVFSLTLFGVISLISKMVNAEKYKAISSFILAVSLLSIVLMIGAAFMQSGLAGQALLFGVVLTVFTTMLMIPFVIFSFISLLADGDPTSLVKGFAMFVTACTLVMIVGALFMQSGLAEQALQFGGILTIFTIMLLIPLALFSLIGSEDSNNIVKQFTSFIITCTLVLIVGALFVKSGLWEQALIFAGIFIGFVWIILLPFIIFSKKLEESLKSVLSFGIFVAIAATILMLGALFIRSYGAEDAIIFGLTVAGFAAIMAGIIWLLSKIDKIGKAILAMAAIAGISLLFGITLICIKNAMSGVDILDMLAGVGVITAIIIAIGGLSIALGALTVVPFFWAGIAAMAAISGIALAFSVTVLNIAKALDVLSSIQNKTIDEGNIESIIDSFINISTKLGTIEDSINLRKINKISTSMMLVAGMVSKLGTTIRDVANLRIADGWNSDGTVKAYRQLRQGDFDIAKDNIGTLVTTLSSALSEAYTKNWVLFETGGIKNVINTSMKMSKMISGLSRAVVNMANMKVGIKWDKEGNPTEFIKLQESDFKNAAINTNTIIKALLNGDGTDDNGGIAKIYKDNKDLFNRGKFDKSHVGRVINTGIKVSKMISGLARAVSNMANLKVADKWDKEGNPISYTKLTHDDFEKAGTNTHTILTSVINSINEIYNTKGNAELFEKNNFERTKVGKVIVAARDIGKMLIDVAAGVKDITELKIPEGTTLQDNINNVLDVILDPNIFEKEDNLNRVKKFYDNLKKIDFKPVEEITKSINNLNVEKVDKFIELSKELRDLNNTVANFDELVNALNGKINDTLIEVAEKLEFAAKAIKDSDESQDKRQQKIKDNVNSLRELLSNKTQIETTESKETIIPQKIDNKQQTEQQNSVDQQLQNAALNNISANVSKIHRLLSSKMGDK